MAQLIKLISLNSNDRIDSKKKLQELPKRYRKIQCTMKLLNASFQPFLMCFANLLLLIVAFLLFGCIRIWHADSRSNLMFPICLMRCAFEAITPLEMAGTVDQKSKALLSNWKEMIEMDGIRSHRRRNSKGPKIKKVICVLLNRKNIRDHKWLELVRRSCPGIRCTAGSMYTFEKSIVLSSLNNCFQLTLNLLVVFD